MRAAQFTDGAAHAGILQGLKPKDSDNALPAHGFLDEIRYLSLWAMLQRGISPPAPDLGGDGCGS